MQINTAVLACLGALVVACAAAAPLHMEAACNYGCKAPCASARRYGLLPCSETITGSITTSAGDYGGWPALYADGTVRANGGVPQAGNLSLHLSLVAAGVRARVPDANFSGRLVIDFEQWRPTWAFVAGADKARYQRFSRALVRAQAPGLAGNATAVEALAKEQFEAAALLFFVETLRLIRRMRPRALAGYWGYPAPSYGVCANFAAGQPPVNVSQCGYYNPTIGPRLRRWNDRLAPLWAASSALYPNAYLYERRQLDPAGEPQVSNATWRARVAVSIASQVAEAVRLSATFGGGIPVVPFLWDIYTTAPFESAVSAADAAMMVSASWHPPLSTTVVVWGYPATYPKHAAIQIQAMNVTGPALLAAKEATAACAAARCGGNGWCSDVHPTDTTTCVCRAGWNGTACETSV
jgi:hyaluronoglucosaminidase